MSEIEKIRQYIDKYSGPHNSRYCIPLREVRVLGELAQVSTYEAICMALSYGQAKGYQAAKAEGRRVRVNNFKSSRIRSSGASGPWRSAASRG